MPFFRLVALAAFLSSLGAGHAAASDVARSPLDSLASSAPIRSYAPAPAYAGQPGFGADPAGYLLWPWRISEQPSLKNSVFVFGGVTSGRDIWSVAAFNLTRSSGTRNYDNYIAGAAYQRDFVRFNGGLVIGGEIGLAERFGHYKSCCDTIIYSNSLLTSPELWGGLAARYDAVNLFDIVRVSPGVVFGLSAIGDPIGQEFQNAVPGKSSARLLFYIGLEGAFSLASMPNTELVVRLHHRSGGYGTLGGLKEGNNANTFGIRYRF